MSCKNCNSTAPLTSFDVQYFYSNQCFDCGDDACAGKTSNSKCVIYTGPNLSCSGINTNDSVETALQKLDTQVCSAIGDYSTYQFNCLPAWFGSAITTEAQFVNAITGYACTLTAIVDTFIYTTYAADQITINNDIYAINNPGITCAAAGVTNTDTLTQVLNKYCTTFGTLFSDIDVSGIVWNNCLVVGSPPATLLQGIQLLADQICQINSSFVLPTINNIGSCLASPGATDSIVDTIGKIKTYMCALPTFNAGAITWGCIASQANLQDSVQAIITAESAIMQAIPNSWSGDFTVTALDPMNPCAGLSVALATPINQDRLVASNGADASPGTLIQKLKGVDIVVDDMINPGFVTLTPDYKLKADVTDTSPDFLDNKVEGIDPGLGISIATSYNVGAQKVDITPVIDFNTLVTNILNAISINPTLLGSLCTLVGDCATTTTSTTSTTTTSTTTSAPTCHNYGITTPSSISVQWNSCADNSIQTATYYTVALVCARVGTLIQTGGSGSISDYGPCAMP